MLSVTLFGLIFCFFAAICVGNRFQGLVVRIYTHTHRKTDTNSLTRAHTHTYTYADYQPHFSLGEQVGAEPLDHVLSLAQLDLEMA